jgi:hypothetical protein
MLLDAINKINELDTIKAVVRKLVDPVSKALRDFEAEKTEKVGLQSVLSNTRTAYDKLRNEVGNLEKSWPSRNATAKRCARTSPSRKPKKSAPRSTSGSARSRPRTPPKSRPPSRRSGSSTRRCAAKSSSAR